MRGHLQADADYQERLIRFIENHDEPRAAATFAPAKARAAAVVMSTLEGARLYHDGQLEGRRTRIPVFLDRGPDEPVDGDLRAFYGRLLRGRGRLRPAGRRVASVRVHRVARQPLLPSSSSPGAGAAPIAPPRRRQSVCGAAQARVQIPWDDLRGRSWELTDRLSGQSFERDGDELSGDGLYVGLDPWASHFLAFK